MSRDIGSLSRNTRSGRRLFQDQTIPSTILTPSVVRTSQPYISHHIPSTTSSNPSPRVTPSIHLSPSIDSTSQPQITQQFPSTHPTPSTHTTPSTDSTPSSCLNHISTTPTTVSQNSTTSTAPNKKNVRGPTVKTVEKVRNPGDPRVRAEFLDGNSLTRSFVTSIGVWIKRYSIFPHNVGNFDDASDDAKRAIYQRIADNFELVEMHEDPNHPPVEPLPVGVGVQGQKVDDPLLVLPASPGLRKCIERHCKDVYKRSTLSLRRKYFNPYETYEDKLAHVPPGMNLDHWCFLVDYWNAPNYEKMRETNRENGRGNVIRHTAGPVSFGVHRKRILDEEGQVDEINFFDETHTSKKSGEFSTEQAAEASLQMKELRTQHTQSDGSCSLTSHQIFTDVRGPKRKGRHLGRGGRFQFESRSTQADLRNMEDRLRADIWEEMEEKMSRMLAPFVALIPPHKRASLPPHMQHYASQEQQDGEDQP